MTRSPRDLLGQLLSGEGIVGVSSRARIALEVERGPIVRSEGDVLLQPTRKVGLRRRSEMPPSSR